MNNWTFRVGPDGLELDAPDRMTEGTRMALWDFASSDIGSSRWAMAEYREAWTALRNDATPDQVGVAGNATSQHIEGDDVVFEALYDQWPTIRISKAEFEEFLNEFDTFLTSHGSDL